MLVALAWAWASVGVATEVYVQWLRFMPRGWCADGLETTMGRAVGQLVREIYGAHQKWSSDARQLSKRPGYPITLQGLPGYGAFETSAQIAENTLRDVLGLPIQRGLQYTGNITDAWGQMNDAMVDHLWPDTIQTEFLPLVDPPAETIKALSDVVSGMLYDLGYFDPGAQRLRDGNAALSSAGNLLHLVKSAFDLLRLPDGMNPKHHIEHLSTSFCRVVDLEFGSLNGTTPIGCFGQDVAVSVSACTRALRQLLPDLEDCEAATATSYEQINGFPARSEACAPPPESLQIHDIFGSGARAPLRFRIDPRMYVPIALDNVHFADAVPDSVRQRESLTYFFLWRAIIISYRTIYPACNRLLGPPDFNYQGVAPARRSTAAQFIPGWHVHRRLNVIEPDGDVLGKPGPSTPLMFFLRSPREPCHLVMVTRGTQSNFEWILDFQFHSRPSVHANSHSILQAGLSTMGYSLLDSVRQMVIDELGACMCNSETKLTFTGHSLGGALSLFLSSAIKDSFNAQGCADVQVRAVSFSTFRGMRNFNKEVIYRSVSDRTDPLYSFPCFHGLYRGEVEGNGRVGWPRCGNGHAVVSGVGRDNFPTPPGRIVMDATRTPNKPFETAQKYVGDVQATMRGFGTNVATALSSYLLSNLSPSRTALELMLQNMESIYYVPTRGELIVGHASSISCGMSNACRADAASKFYWRCSQHIAH